MPSTATCCIEADEKGFAEQEAIYITRIDRKSTAHFPSIYPGVKQVCVLPGKHEVSIYYELGQRCSDAKMSVETKPGASYRIRKIGDRDRVFFWVQEDTDGWSGATRPAP